MQKEYETDKTSNSCYAHEQVFQSWQSVCCIMALWSIFRLGGKKIPDSINVVRIYRPARLQRVSWSILTDTIQVLGKRAHCLLWWQNLVKLCLSCWDLVGCFSLSTFPPFQLGVQFGFHCRCQQQQLCFMPWLGSKIQLSCCDSSCWIFGSNESRNAGLQVTHAAIYI